MSAAPFQPHAAMIRQVSFAGLSAARPACSFRARPAAGRQALAALALWGLLSGPALAQALGGMDPVSLRDAGRPVGGDAAISTHWKGHEWRFSNDANRAAFEANPGAYAPGFGGNCPVALADGQRHPGEPQYFVVLNGTVYLTGSASARERLRREPAILDLAARAWKKQSR